MDTNFERFVLRISSLSLENPSITYGIYEKETDKLVREIKQDKMYEFLRWLDEYKRQIPSLLGVVDVLVEHSFIDDYDEARAIVRYWQNRREKGEGRG